MTTKMNRTKGVDSLCEEEETKGNTSKDARKQKKEDTEKGKEDKEKQEPGKEQKKSKKKKEASDEWNCHGEKLRGVSMVLYVDPFCLFVVMLHRFMGW